MGRRHAGERAQARPLARVRRVRRARQRDPAVVRRRGAEAHVARDALHGILDYLAPRFKGHVVVAESSAGDTMQGYDNFLYSRVAAEHRSQHVSLVDLNVEARYEVIPLLDFDLHVTPVRLANGFECTYSPPLVAVRKEPLIQHP